MVSTTRRVNIAEIISNDGLQAREKLDPATVDDYREIYAAGNPDSLPPVVVFCEGPKGYLLADGFHRLAAAKAAGLANIAADVRDGTRRDAVLHAVGSNAAHGLRRSAADKRRAVRMLLDDPEWSGKSDRWIAEQCRVHHQMVARCRTPQLDDHPVERKGRDGKVRKAPKPASAPEPTPAQQQVRDFFRDRTEQPTADHIETPAPASTAAIVLDSCDRPVPDNLRAEHGVAAQLRSLATQLNRVLKDVDAVARTAGGRHLDLCRFRTEAEALRSQLTGAAYLSACPRCDGHSRKRAECSRCNGSGFLPVAMRGRLSADEKATLGIG